MIKEIFDEIAAESSTNNKIEILRKYEDNELLKRVFYLAKSGRIKFHLKQIPEYQTVGTSIHLEWGLEQLGDIIGREVTGNDAIAHLKYTLESLNPDDAYIIERIIDKSLKIGMGRTQINKVFPKLIEKTGYMGCKPYNEAKVAAVFAGGKMGVSEVKADGRFSNAVVSGNIAELESRAGEEVLIGDCTLMGELATFPDCVLHGEFVIPQFKREISNGIMTSIINITKKLNSGVEGDITKAEKSKDKLCTKYDIEYQDLLNSITYIVWDILEIDGYYGNNSDMTRIERLNRLIFTVEAHHPTKIEVVEHKFVYSVEEALEHFAEKLAEGEEGTVLKTVDGLWRDGKRYNQIKMKVEFDLDLKIVGFNYGKENTKNEHVISSVTCESSDGILSTRAQGIPEDLMDYITENQDALMGTILTLKCNGLSSNREGGHSVLYPALQVLRDDKTVANSFEECLEIDAAAKGLKVAAKV